MSDHTKEIRGERLQLWPSGRYVEIATGPPTGNLIRDIENMTAVGDFRPMTDEDKRAVEIQQTAERIQRENILKCDSCLIDTLLKAQATDDGRTILEYEDIENLYPDPSDWTHEQCRDWLQERGTDLPDDDADLEEWWALIRDNAEAAEIYEWYAVTSWLCGKLRAIGECVLDTDYGCWWGRTCTGQALIMDATLQQVATAIIDA